MKKRRWILTSTAAANAKAPLLHLPAGIEQTWVQTDPTRSVWEALARWLVAEQGHGSQAYYASLATPSATPSTTATPTYPRPVRHGAPLPTDPATVPAGVIRVGPFVMKRLTVAERERAVIVAGKHPGGAAVEALVRRSWFEHGPEETAAADAPTGARPLAGDGLYVEGPTLHAPAIAALSAALRGMEPDPELADATIGYLRARLEIAG